MASRRVRIKGIANIPQRKRPHEQLSSELKSNEKPSTPNEPETLINSKQLHETHPSNETDAENKSLINKLVNVNSPKQNDILAVTNINDLPNESGKIISPDVKIDNGAHNQSIEESQDGRNINDVTVPTKPKIILKSVITFGCSYGSDVKVDSELTNKPNLSRRFIKPKLSINAIKKNARSNDDVKQVSDVFNNTQTIIKEVEQNQNENVEVDVIYNNITFKKDDEILDDEKSCEITSNVNKITACNDFEEDNVSSNNNVIKRRSFVKPTVSIKAFNRTKIKNVNENVLKENEVSLDEVIPPKDDSITNQSSPIVFGVNKLPKLNFVDASKPGSDTEYSPIISSPGKFVNRARIKAVPRLGQRRTSFSIGSASESEDDTRRTYNRVRNDSVSSSATVNNEVLETQAAIKNEAKKEFNMVIQRKCRRTEQSRKLAEARRDFQRKFNSGKPDRQRLTMMDLIFYNPITAPMSQKKKRNESESVSISTDNPPENTQKSEAASISDEENVIPAPQIKIGPNGEITIDEQSLVVESEKIKKDREALKNTGIIDGDFDTNYGIYKRKKRSKDWNKEETLLFYKALNTIGTDFTLMNELFPNRNRKELKMKFKKEERINRNLIDRAVMNPIHFDLTELRREVEKTRQQREEIEKIINQKGDKNDVKKKNGRGNMGAYVTTPETVNIPVKSPVTTPIKRRRISKIKPKQNVLMAGVKSIINKLHTESDTSDSDDNKPLIKRCKTRSGRISRPAEKFEANDKTKTEKKEDLHDVKPGSIMILTEANEEGKPTYNIYTVDEDGKKIRIDLTDEILKNLTQDEGGKPEKGNSTEVSIGLNISDLNNSDMVINGDSMIIPFEEFDTQVMLENEKTLE